MRYFFVLLLLFLFTSCSFLEERSITVKFPSTHLWEEESGNLMWYTLRYFDGEEVKKQTLYSGNRRAKVKVKRGKTCYFEAIPEDSYHPFGGGCNPNDEDTVYLTQEDGILADILIECALCNPNQSAALDYEVIKSKVIRPFNEDKLLLDLLNGEFSPSKYKVKEVPITLSSLPSGRYIPELDSDPYFVANVGQDVVIKLTPGIHRFLCLEKRFLRTVAIDENLSVKIVDTASVVF